MLNTFVTMRLAVGGMSYLMPNLSGKLIGFDPDRNPQAAYWARLFGIRDVVLGLGASQTDGKARKQILQFTAACDAADLASTLIGRRAGYLSTPTTILAGSMAVMAGAVAMAAAAEAGRPQA